MVELCPTQTVVVVSQVIWVSVVKFQSQEGFQIDAHYKIARFLTFSQSEVVHQLENPFQHQLIDVIKN